MNYWEEFSSKNLQEFVFLEGKLMNSDYSIENIYVFSFNNSPID